MFSNKPLLNVFKKAFSECFQKSLFGIFPNRIFQKKYKKEVGGCRGLEVEELLKIDSVLNSESSGGCPS